MTTSARTHEVMSKFVAPYGLLRNVIMDRIKLRWGACHLKTSWCGDVAGMKLVEKSRNLFKSKIEAPCRTLSPAVCVSPNGSPSNFSNFCALLQAPSDRSLHTIQHAHACMPMCCAQLPSPAHCQAQRRFHLLRVGGSTVEGERAPIGRSGACGSRTSTHVVTCTCSGVQPIHHSTACTAP